MCGTRPSPACSRGRRWPGPWASGGCTRWAGVRWRRIEERRTAMFSGAHVIVYSKDAEADRAFFRDVLDFPHVDVGHGWLIFALPPAELAVHPAEANDSHELYLMCDDLA